MYFPEIDLVFAIIKNHGNPTVKVIDDRRFLMGQVVYKALLPVGVDEPVLGYAGVGIFLQL